MVSARITSTVLHMADKGIVPIDQIKRPIGSKLHIHWSKISVRTLHQIVAKSTLVARPVVNESVLLHSLEANCVVDKNIALDFIGKMTTGHKLQT